MHEDGCSCDCGVGAKISKCSLLQREICIAEGNKSTTEQCMEIGEGKQNFYISHVIMNVQL